MTNRYESVMRELGFEGEKGFLRKPENILTEEQLRAVEEELGFALPKDFRNFFAYYHGALFRTDLEFPLRYPDSNMRGIIGHIFDNKSSWDIVHHYHNWIDNDPWDLRFYSGLQDFRPFDPTIDEETEGIRYMQSPTNLLWIGSTTCSNSVAIVIDGAKLGQIYYWLNTTYASDDGKGIYLVADSFDEFMHLLKQSPDENY
jgi:hypothetical protein